MELATGTEMNNLLSAGNKLNQTSCLFQKNVSFHANKL